ncbi:MAG: hypothetical protein IKC77_07255 [Lentisphaeria bacterium]|nr:hypothetical protein [Lentisphaeria bacterium]
MADVRNFSSKKIGRPRKATSWTAEALAEAARKYFAKCDRRTKTVVTKDGVERIPNPAPYSIEGFCSYISILRNEFTRWRKGDDELAYQAELIHQTITANRMEGALDGTQNSSFAQFLLKNNNAEHYKDKIEVENSINAEAVSMFQAWSEQWKSMR